MDPRESPNTGILIGGTRVPFRTALAGIVALGLFARVLWPLADPPRDLSWSTGIYTDPASKTLPARYAVQHGDWTLAETQFLAAFPLANALTFVTYRVLGPGRWSHQILAALVSTAGLLALALALRRGPGVRAAVLGSLLAALSFWLVMFGRIPVVENLVAALLAWSCAMAFSRGTGALAAAGGIAAAAALFGKYHAAAFLPALFLFVWGRNGWRAVGPVFLGAMAVGAVWLVTIFLPWKTEILAYLGDLSPDTSGVSGVRPPIEFLHEIFFSVRLARVFNHDPLLGTLGLVFALRTVSCGTLRRKRLADGSALFALWFLLVWIYYAFLAYRAPRYYIVIGPALAACAGCQLAAWFGAEKMRIQRPSLPSVLRAAPMLYAVGVVVLDPIRHAVGAIRIAERSRHPETGTALFNFLGPWNDALSSDGHLAWGGAVAAALLAAWWMVATVRAGRATVPLRSVALGVMAVAMLTGVGRLGAWATHRTYILEEIKEGLPPLIAPDSVLLGPLAALLTQDSRLLAISWLVPSATPLLDRVTHRVDEERSDATGLASRVPEGMEARRAVHGWEFRTRSVRTVRLSRLQGARNRLTPFELGGEAMSREAWEEALDRFAEHARISGETDELMFTEASCWFSLGQPARARELLHRALEQSPGNPLYLLNLGIISYKEGDVRAALGYWKGALREQPHQAELLGIIRTAAGHAR